MLWVVIVLVVVLLAGFLSGNYFYNMALDPAHDKRRALRPLDLSEPKTETSEKPVSFFTEKPFTDLFLRSYDGLRLHALSLEQAGEDWVIVLHGYTSAAVHMGDPARVFYDMGYNLLLPDARGHGQSEGRYIGMGWHERRDVCAWIDLLLERHPQARILLYGVSMGGATVMMTAGEALPPNVKGAIEDCGYSSAAAEFRFNLRTYFKLPAPLAAFVLFFADIVTRIRAGYSIYEASALRQLQRSTLPMLFIHGEEDRYVPFYMLAQVYAATKTTDKQKLPVPGAGHGMAASVAPEAYWRAVRAFAERMMG